VSQNGRLGKDKLRRIYHPTDKVYLDKEAAASWNTLRIVCKRYLRTDIYPLGSRSAYRSYEDQLYFWNLYQSGQGNLAAYPGTSNHGWGKAIDLAATPMRSVIDRIGSRFGWKKIEAPSEWWHVNYVGGFSRPNPGTSAKYPVARRGSGGRGQKWFVRKLQRRLRAHGFPLKNTKGEFNKLVEQRVKDFQRDHKLVPDGVVGKRTWRKLLSKPRPKPVPVPQKPQKPPTPAPKPPVVEKPVPKPPKPPQKLPADLIDVSNHQGDINWKKVKQAKQAGVYLKLSEGQDWRDPSMNDVRLQQIEDAGILYGWYHFLRPKKRDAALEARFFIDEAKKLGGWGDLLPVADIEVTTLSPEETGDYLARFLGILRREGGCKRVLVYASPGWWDSNVARTERLHAQLPYCEAWIAHWDVKEPDLLKGIPAWALHQYTDSGQVSGVTTPVDMNRTRDIRDLLIKKS